MEKIGPALDRVGALDHNQIAINQPYQQLSRRCKLRAHHRVRPRIGAISTVCITRIICINKQMRDRQVGTFQDFLDIYWIYFSRANLDNTGFLKGLPSR